ncbi:MAG: transposase [Hyphomonadaceae bacterium]|nr:transposase [Hyphomonadaceae bacterium]
MDEVFVKITGVQHYLWRAIDHEGEVLEVYVTKKRARFPALKFLKKALKNYGVPREIVTNKLRSCCAAMNQIGNADRQVTGRYLNNLCETSRQPFRRRERAMSRFRRMSNLQKFAATDASAHNHFNHQRNIERRLRFKSLRNAALSEWRELLAA